MLSNTCTLLNKDVDTLIDDVYFIIDNYDEYLKYIIDKKVLNDNIDDDHLTKIKINV